MIERTYNSLTVAWDEHHPQTLRWLVCLNDDEANAQVVETNPTYTFTGLTPNTQYTVKVKGHWNDEYTSDWSQTRSFTTRYPCPTPTELTASNISDHTADISWTVDCWMVDWNNLNSCTSCTLAWREKNTTPPYNRWTEVNIGKKQSYTLTGLNPGVTYQVKVMNDCTSTNQGESEYSEVFEFTTTGCHATTSLAASNIGSNSATLTWESEASQWEVAYSRFSSFSSFTTTMTVNTPTCNPTGLANGTRYFARVRSVCNGINYGEWSDVIEFTTDCYQTSNLQVGDITATTATLSWEGDATEWQVNYRIVGMADSDQSVRVYSNTCTLTHLFTASNYSVSVAAVCNNSYGNWVHASFTTEEAPDCFASNLEATAVGSTTADFVWDGSSDSYVMAYRNAANPISTFDLLSEDFEDGFYYGLRFSENAVVETTSQSAFVHSGNMGLSIKGAATITNMEWFTPELVSYETEFAFWYRHRNGQNSTIQVGYSSGELDEIVYGNPIQPKTQWQEFRAIIPVGTKYVSIKFNGYNTQYLYLDDITVTRKSNVEYVPCSSTSNTLYNLDPETTYEVYVIGDCGEFGWSEPSEPVTFTTAEYCPLPTNLTASNPTTESIDLTWQGTPEVSAYMLTWRSQALVDAPFSENFEDPDSFDRWTFVSMNEANAIGMTNGAGRLGAPQYHPEYAYDGLFGFQFASFNEIEAGETYDQYLISPELGSFSARNLQFYFRNFTSLDNLRIGYSTTTNDIAAFTWEELQHSDSWKAYTKTLPDEVKYIAFHYNPGEKYYWAYVDDITIGGFTMPWTTTNFFEAPSGTVEAGYTIEGLAPNTRYIARVRNNCKTTWSNSISFKTNSYEPVELAIAGYGDDPSTEEGWNLIALPLEHDINPGNVGNMLNNDYDLYAFDGAFEGEEWRNHKNRADNGFGVLSRGQGYLYANSSNVSLSFVGAPIPTNSYTVGLETADTKFGNWHLVGNSFNATADVSVEDYYSLGWNIRRLIPSSGQVVSMRGIFVESNSDVTEVTFTKATRGSRGVESPMVNIDLRNAEGHLLDRARLRMGEGNNLSKLDMLSDPNRLYFRIDGKDYAVARVNGQGEMPLNFDAAQNGTYSLNVNVEGMEMAYLHLIDNMTGEDIDLLATSTGSVAKYTFTGKPSDYASRFRLVFETGSSAEGDSFAFIDAAGNIVITNAEAGATLQVIDVTGRVVLSTDVARGVSTKGMTSGVYVLRLINGNDVMTQKIVVE